MSGHLTGFTAPVFDSQSVFRAVMNAFARPGQKQVITCSMSAPEGVPLAAYAVLLALVDMDTPVFLGRWGDDRALLDDLIFHTHAPVTAEPQSAAFVLVDGADFATHASRFFTGTSEYPDRGATVIVEVAGFDGTPNLRLSGPGLKDGQEIAVRGLPAEFVPAMAANRASFPLGFDVLLVSGAEMIGLPRSTRVEAF